MKRKLAIALVLCLAFVAVMAASAAPAAAITYGWPDGQGHPNVGQVVVGFIGDDGELLTMAGGSGTLIAPGVFLTAGHVADFIRQYDMFFWVNFDPVYDPGDRSRWLTGEMIINPAYQPHANDRGDLAVVLLRDPKRITKRIQPARLPPLGCLDDLAASGALRDQTFTCVGYGLQERVHSTTGPPDYTGWEDFGRRWAVSSFLALTGSWVHMSQNPALGDGGTCYADSGGPYFLGDSNMVVATTVRGDHVCRAEAINYRLDTPEARAFLDDFVTLP